MPRSGWLAVGAAIAALLGPASGAGVLGLAVGAGVAAAFAIDAGGTAAHRLRSGGSHRRRSPAWPLLAGAAAIAVRLLLGPAGPPAAGIPTGAGPWTAIVETAGSPIDGSQTATIRLESAALRVAATLPRYPAIGPGDRIRVDGEIRPPPEGGYGEFLRRSGVVGTIRSRTLERLADPAAIRPEVALERLRRSSGDALTRALPEPEAGLAAGILVGLRDRVDRDLAAAFTTAGVSHVVAISGWNIAIVAATVGAASGRLSRRRRSVLITCAIAAYVLFAGASPSVLRAAAMAAVVLAARESGRAGRAAAALGWAAAILLVTEPALVTDAGFQLSTIATAGLLRWGTSFTSFLAGPSPGRLRRTLADVLGVSLAAQLATLPLILVAFGRLSIVSPAVNLVVVPLVAPAMAAGAVAFVAGWLVALGAPAIVGTLAGLPAWAVLAAIVAVVRFAAAVPLASVTLTMPLSAIAAGLIVAGIALARTAPTSVWRRAAARLNGRDRPATAPGRRSGGGTIRSGTGTGTPARRMGGPGRLALVAVAVAIVGFGLAFAHRPDGATRIIVLDVGQGDGILVEGSRGGRMLIDGGPDPDRLLVALDEQLPPWDRRLDLVVLSHPHEDHVAGLALLLARYRVGRIAEPGMLGPGPGYHAWSAAVEAGGRPHGTLQTGDALVLDDLRLSVLWPDPDRVPRQPPDTGTAINNVSIVLLGEVAGRRILLAGDIEQGVDPILVGRGLPAVDVLKVAHHGSRTASTDAFLDAARPGIAIVSAGAGNPYGHPAPTTIARLRARTGRVYRTDTNGTVEVTIGRAGIGVSMSGPRPSRPKRATPPGTGVRTASATATPSAFLCAVPNGGDDGGGSPPGPPIASPAGSVATTLYHRDDVGPRAGGRRLAAALALSAALVPPARGRRGRGRGLAGGAVRGGRSDREPTPRRGGRPAPRCRQDPAAGRSRAPPAARRRLGRLAGPPRPSGARERRGQPPGHPPPRCRASPAHCAGSGRGRDRRVRGQASRPATRADDGPVRVVASTLSGDRWRRGRSGHRRDLATRTGARGPGLRPCRRRAGRRAPAALGRVGAQGSSMTAAPIGFFWGDDAYSIESAVEAFRMDEGRFPGGAPERWRIRGDAASTAATMADLEERLATATMFGGGTLAVLAGIGPLVRKAEDRAALIALFGVVAEGNGLAIVEETESGRREPPHRAVADALAAAGGVVRELRAPRAAQLAAWIGARASERGVRLGPGAARELATRIGGFVAEGDVDRRRQGGLAIMELDKLALYRPEGEIRPDDVRALVPEAVPGSIWAFVDAVGGRLVGRALELHDRLAETTPEPVLVAVLHRRIRELIEIADRLESGESPGSLVRSMRLNPFRAETLARQAAAWTTDELVAALDGLVELDATVKGAEGMPAGEAQHRLAIVRWIVEAGRAGVGAAG